ncbi:uncharacterized protein [Prorops nasuta]|uniref:uncharacterized protein n=1 Tax=Prorops nasuta TaxID=863751 RepID=UPI0034D008C9
MKEPTDWPIERPRSLQGELPEAKVAGKLSALTTTTNEFDLFERYSSFSKLQRITAWILRYYRNSKDYAQRVFGEHLTPRELERAICVMIKVIQSSEFGQELQYLGKNERVAMNSRIRNLNPFIDENGLLKVGGRLKHAKLSYDATFPILLPKNHSFTNLLIINEHNRLNHAGVMVVLNSLRQNYWPIHGRSTVEKMISKCVSCFKTKPSAFNPPMGNLPSDRVTPSRAFETCGVDYAGPIFIKDGKLRNRSLVKSFISRRGLCRHIYSDNGSNFVGPKNELAELGFLLTETTHVHEIWRSLSNELINWTFIPPHAPNFGGLWERAVKSVKSQLKVMIGRVNLTFEEISTVLAEVRAKGSREFLKLEPNMMVLVKEDNLPPLQWALGRIQEVHPGSDGIARVATVLTSKGQIKRAAVKLCPLPMENV